MTKFVVIVGFAVAFAAGLIVGAEMRQSSIASPVTPSSPTTQSTTRPSRRGYLPTELNLSPQQQDEMKKIWSDGGKLRDEQQEKRQALKKQREEAIAAMLGPVDKAKYDEIQKKYQDQTQALDREMRASFEEKVRQTNAILTPEQRQKYEDFLKHHSDRGGPPRGGDHGDHGGDRGGPRGEGFGGGPPPHDREHSRGPDAGATSNPSSLP